MSADACFSIICIFLELLNVKQLEYLVFIMCNSGQILEKAKTKL